jgi:divalent metal cation (Fe/Co/Zn/Cd) transporter
VRTRRAGIRTFVDVTLAVPRTANFERVHDISDRVEEAVRGILPGADVMVHMEPRAPTNESLFDQVRAIAQKNDLLVHELAAHAVRGEAGEPDRLILDLDVEVDPRLTLREAHALADRVEKEILRELPRVTEVNTHIEVLGREVAPAADLEELTTALEAHLRDAPLHFRDLLDIHQVQVHEVEGKILASCHATLDGSLPIGRVHDLTQELETRTRRHFPQLFRFTIHTEPPEEH